MSKNGDAQTTDYSSNVPVSARIGSGGKFRKVLSLRDLYFISLGSSIGSAWLFGSLYGASTAGPASILSWMIGGIFILFVAIVWAELGGMLPSTGAVVKIPSYTHGSFAGFYFGWAYYLSAVIILPVEAVAIVTYASAYLPGLFQNGSLAPEGYAACVLIILVTFLFNSFGVKLFARFNLAITWWKVLVPTITVIVTLLYFYPPNFSSYSGFAPYGFSPVFSAVGTAGIIVAYTGFRSAMDYSGEARNPAKDVPRAMIFSVITTIILYTLLQVGFVGGVRWAESGVKPGDWAALATLGAYSTAPFFKLMSILGISLLATVLLIDAIISPFGTVSVYAGSSARDLYALTEGTSAAKLSEVHSKHGVPRTALLISLAIGIFFVFAFPSWGKLATISTSAAVFTQLAGSASLMTLRQSAPQLRGSFKVPFAKIFAPIVFIMSSFIVYWITWPYTGYSMVAFAIGILLFFIVRSRGDYRWSEIRHGLWIVTYSILLAMLSYLGSYGKDLIKFPTDFALVAVVALLCYFWGVRSGYKSGSIIGLLKQEEVESSIE